MPREIIDWNINISGDATREAANLKREAVDLRGAVLAGSRAITAGGAAAIAAAAGYKALADEIVAVVDEMDTLSQGTGIAIETVNGMRIAARASGKELRDFFPNQLPKKMAQAAQGLEEASRGFRTIGVEVVEADGTLRDINEVLPEVIDKLHAIEDPTQRAAAATLLLEEKGAALLSAFGSSTELVEFTDQAERFAIDVGPEAVARAEEWKQANANLALGFEMVKNSIFETFGDTTNFLIERFTAGMIVLSETVLNIARGMPAAVAGVEAFKKAVDFVGGGDVIVPGTPPAPFVPDFSKADKGGKTESEKAREKALKELEKDIKRQEADEERSHRQRERLIAANENSLRALEKRDAERLAREVDKIEKQGIRAAIEGDERRADSAAAIFTTAAAGDLSALVGVITSIVVTGPIGAIAAAATSLVAGENPQADDVVVSLLDQVLEVLRNVPTLISEILDAEFLSKVILSAIEALVRIQIMLPIEIAKAIFLAIRDTWRDIPGLILDGIAALLESLKDLIVNPLTGPRGNFLGTNFRRGEDTRLLGINLPDFLGFFDQGTPFVQRDGLAMLHRGERVVPARENRAGMMRGGATIGSINLHGVRDMRSFTEQLQRELGAFGLNLRIEPLET
jgi:hypothetical protein